MINSYRQRNAKLHPPPPMARSYNGKHSITSPHVEDHYSARSSVIGMELPSASSTLQESYAAVEKPQATELMIRLAVSSPARWPENIPAQAHGRLRYTKDLGSAPAPSHGCFPSHSPSYPEKNHPDPDQFHQDQSSAASQSRW